MKPFLLVPKAWAQALERGSLCCERVVSLQQETRNFQRLSERFNLWRYAVGFDNFPDRLGIASWSYTNRKEMGDLWVPVVMPLCAPFQSTNLIRSSLTSLKILL